MKFQVGEDVSLLQFVLKASPPCFRESAGGMSARASFLGQELFAFHERQETLEISGFHAFCLFERGEDFHDAGAQVAQVEIVPSSREVDLFFAELINDLPRFSIAQPAFEVQDGIAQGNGAADVLAWHVDGIALRVAGVEKERLHLIAGKPHVVMQGFLVERHLHLMFIFGRPHRVFVGLPAFQLNQFFPVSCQQVHASLQPEGFTEEGGFQLHLCVFRVYPGDAEMVPHVFADVVELLSATVEKHTVDVRQGGPGQRVVAETPPDGTQVEGFFVGVCFAFRFVHTVVKELVGGVTHLYGSRSGRRAELE